MSSPNSTSQAGPYSVNYTYLYEYSRGLDGVDIPLNNLISEIICGTLGLVAFTVLVCRIFEFANGYIRHVSCLSGTPRQQYFWSITSPDGIWPWIKKHIIHAPLLDKRHHREFHLASNLHMGILPSRLHTFLLVIYALSQVAYCAILDYHVNEKPALVAELRGRAGGLAVLNMIPLFLFAGRNNVFIWLLGISFDTYNLFHRWLGRIVVVEAIVHVIAWFVNAVDEQNFADALQRIGDTPFFSYGALAMIAMLILISQSPSPIRHAFYEIFLHLHQFSAILVLVGVFYHLHIDALPQRPWIAIIITIWCFERAMRWARRFALNVDFQRRSGRNTTRVVVKALPGEACRVTFHLPKRINVKPGSHVYAFFPTISWWMSHPFSVAWVDPPEHVTPSSHPPAAWMSDKYNLPYDKKKLMYDNDSLSSLEKQDFSAISDDESIYGRKQTTQLSLVIAAHAGMTRQLYNKAMACPDQTLRTCGFIEGPYNSGTCSMGSYGTAILFSGGAGITHHMMHVRDLLMRADEGTVATQRIYLIWSIRSTESLNWVREWMDSILRLPNRKQILTIKLFISKPKKQHEIKSPSQSLQMFPGRCVPSDVLVEALARRVGATVVSVCGPGAFADEVRDATRKVIGSGVNIDFVEESFSW